VSDRVLSVRSRQRQVKIDQKLLRTIVAWLLAEEIGLKKYELSLQFVGADEITALNEEYLRHEGSTDVITFDYGSSREQSMVIGDVIICIDEAITQAPGFRSTWQMELVRYVVHGVLHLLGFDDKTSAKRERMKRREDDLVRRISQRFTLSRIGARRPVSRKSRRV